MNNLQALTIHYENVTITTNADLIIPLQEDFEKMWTAFDPESQS